VSRLVGSEMCIRDRAATMGRIFANTHAEAQDMADIEAQEEFAGDYADAMRLQDKDARSFGFEAAGFPVARS
jgi:hypothetical protein